MKKFFFIVISTTLYSLATYAAEYNVDTHIPVNENIDKNTFVLIISNEEYKHEESVPYSLNDGSTFRVYCEKTLGIPEKNIKYMANASLNDMNFGLAWLERVMKAYKGDARAIFYYSGHGMPDDATKQAYLLPVDGYSTYAGSGLSLATIFERLGDLPSAGTMVFLDACFSGARRDGSMMQSSRGVAITPKRETLHGYMVVFSATKDNETSLPYKEKKHGLFTYFILKKLQENGGEISLGALADYVTDNVVRISSVENDKTQTPTITVSSSSNDWRRWQFAQRAATRYITLSAPKKTPEVIEATIIREPTEDDVPPTPTSLSDNEETLQLVAQGKKAKRALDYIKAAKYFKDAVAKNSLEATYQLGLLYADNNYREYNKETAIEYFEKAAKANHVDANYQLGILWLGTDNTIARKYFRAAADKGHQVARKQLEKLRY